MKGTRIIFLSVIVLIFTLTNAEENWIAVAMKESNEDAVALNTAFMSMEKQLQDAPVALAVLSRICLIATQRDFPLNDGKYSPDYKHLTYPNSFRASLNQVSNYGYFAFLEAHTGMHRIMLESANTPDHLEEALNILFYGNQQDVELFFPISIQKVKRIADTCAGIALKVADQFYKVKEVIGEFQTASINKQSSTQNLTIWTERKKKHAKKELLQKKAALEEVNKKYAKAEELLKEKNKQYNKAFDKMTPSMGELFTGVMIDAVEKLLCNPVIGTSGSKSSEQGQDDSANFELSTANNDLTTELTELKEGLNFQSYFYNNGSIKESTVLGTGSFASIDDQIMKLDRKQTSISKKKAYQKKIPARKEKALDAISTLRELLVQLKNEAQIDTEQNTTNSGIQKQLANATDKLIAVLTNNINGPTPSNNALAFDLTLLIDFEAVRVKQLIGKTSINATLVDEIIDALEEKVQTLQGHKSTGANDVLIEDGLRGANELLNISRSLKDMAEEGISTNLRKVQKKFGQVMKALNTVKHTKIPTVLNKIAISRKEYMPSFNSNNGKDSGDFGGNTNQRRMKSAYFSMQTAQGQMELAQKLADHEFDRKLEKAREVDNLVLEIMEFKASEATLKEILDILGKAIKAIGELQKSWSNLVVFFKEISNFIDVYLGNRLNDFVNHANATAGIISKYNSGLSTMNKELLFNSAMQASRGSYMVNVQASTYHDISEAHLMPMVDNLGVLISLDPENDRAEIAEYSRNLTIIAKEIPKKIKSIIQGNKEEYDKNVLKRKEELTQYFGKFYPLPPKSIEDKVKNIVDDSIGQVGFDQEAVDQVNPNDQINNSAYTWNEDSAAEDSSDDYGF